MTEEDERVDRQLEESRERYRLLFEQSPVGIVQYNSNLLVTECNDTFRQFIGSDFDKLIGLDLRQLKDQRVVPALQAALDGREGRYEGPYEATTTTARLWVALRTVPFRGSSGEVEGGICIVEDVTERKKVEALQRATYEISEAVHASEDLDELFRSIHEILARLMPADNIFFALYHPQEDTISFPYAVERCDRRQPFRLSRAEISGLTQRVLQSGGALLADRREVERMVADRRLKPGRALPESWLGAPLRRGPHTIGVVTLQSYDPEVAFDDWHREILEFVADQVAMAIQRKRHEEQIERMAFFDTLTGLYNRRMLEERAQHSLELARRHRWPAALLFLDLDRFKRINDTLGHAAGDELLVEVARIFKSEVRATDTLARLGGDEFSFLLDDTDADRARDVARRVLDLLDRPFEIRGQHLRIGASVGIALFPDHGDSLEDLLKSADIAMYRAKAGGGSFRIFEPGSPFTRQQLQLESELRQAVAAGDLELQYQPIESLVDGGIVGIEALVRWRRAEELLAASEFIPLAEESDLIRLLDFQVLRQALSEASSLLSGRTLEIAVNLSSRSLYARDLPGHLRAILEQSGLAPERVVLEVTETAAVHDPVSAVHTLQRIAEIGIRLAMDDFGTGFASLTYLRNMPLNRVKIDSSLIAQLGIDPKGERLVESAIDLAHGLGLEVVGEGVERPGQLDWLRRHDCDLAQGFLVGHPVEASRVRSIIGSA